MRFLWQVESYLQRSIEGLRSNGTTTKVAVIVRDLIGSQWGASQQSVQNGMRRRTGGIPKGERQRLVLLLPNRVSAAPAASVKSESAQPETKPLEKVSERTIEKGKFCMRFIADLRKINTQTRERGLTIAELQENFPDLIAWKVRDTLPEDNRDVFNHPRQWGPVVGYALDVLAMHFDRDTESVKRWLKASRHAAKVQNSNS